MSKLKISLLLLICIIPVTYAIAPVDVDPQTATIWIYIDGYHEEIWIHTNTTYTTKPFDKIELRDRPETTLAYFIYLPATNYNQENGNVTVNHLNTSNIFTILDGSQRIFNKTSVKETINGYKNGCSQCEFKHVYNYDFDASSSYAFTYNNNISDKIKIDILFNYGYYKTQSFYQKDPISLKGLLWFVGLVGIGIVIFIAYCLIYYYYDKSEESNKTIIIINRLKIEIFKKQIHKLSLFLATINLTIAVCILLISAICNNPLFIISGIFFGIFLGIAGLYLLQAIIRGMIKLSIMILLALKEFFGSMRDTIKIRRMGDD